LSSCLFGRGTDIPISGQLQRFLATTFGCKLLNSRGLSTLERGQAACDFGVQPTMDIQRPSNARAKKIKRIVYVSVAVLVIAAITLGLSRLRPAAPSVDRGTVWTDAVKRGPMLREVRGLGTLVPEDIHWIPALTAARIDRIVIRPGHLVKP